MAPVVIPALAPSLDRSLKGDRSLCPVRALRYYLDRTADLRQNNSNSNSNSTFIALNLCQKTDSKAHHTKTLFNIQKPETLQGSAPRRKQKGDWKFRVGMLFQRGMTSTLT